MLDDGIANDGRIGRHKAVRAAACEAEGEDVAWPEIFERLEDQLRGQLGEGDDGIALSLARFRLALQALGALVVEGEGGRCVLEGRRLIVAGARIAGHGRVSVCRHVYAAGNGRRRTCAGPTRHMYLGISISTSIPISKHVMDLK